MNRRVLLIEPNYKNKYPPMGLMKIATYYRRCKDDVRFYKGDWRTFAAQLLCEEFYKEIGENSLAKYFSKFFRISRTAGAGFGKREQTKKGSNSSVMFPRKNHPS